MASVPTLQWIGAAKAVLLLLATVYSLRAPWYNGFTLVVGTRTEDFTLAFEKKKEAVSLQRPRGGHERPRGGHERPRGGHDLCEALIGGHVTLCVLTCGIRVGDGGLVAFLSCGTPVGSDFIM
jgi:hypothetical protein